MPDQVPDEVKRERIERLVEVVQRVAAERNARARRAGRGGARRGSEPHRPVAAPRPDAPQHDGELHRRRRFRRARRRAGSRLPRRRHSRAARRRSSPRSAARARDLRPDGVRQDGRRRGDRRSDPGRGRLGRLDAGVPRAADPHGSARATRHGSSPSGSSTTRPRSSSTRRSRTRPSTRHSPTAERPSSSGGTGLYLRAALSDLGAAAAGRARSAGSGSTTVWGPSAPTPLLAERDPPRRRVSTRTTAVASSARSSWPRSASRSSPAGTRLWSGETRHPTLVFGLDVPREELERRIVERTHAMFDAGVEDEVERALGRRRLAHRTPRARPRRDRAAAPGRGDRRGSLAYPPVRRLPAEVDAEDAGSDQGRGGEARGRGRG